MKRLLILLSILSLAIVGSLFLPSPEATAQSMLRQGQVANYCADAGSTDAYACNMSPALAAYTTGACYAFKANTVNTGASTLNLNSLGAKTIKKPTATTFADLADADIRAGQIVQVCYDGTNMVMISQLGNAGGGTAVTPSTRNTYANLPTCDSTIIGQLFYPTDTPKYAQCNGTSWQWFVWDYAITLPPTSSWTSTGGGDTTTTPTGSVLLVQASGGGALAASLRAVPAAPFTITATLRMFATGDYNGCGIIVSDGTTDGAGNQLSMMIKDTPTEGPSLRVDLWTNFSNFVSNKYGTDNGLNRNGPIQMRYKDDNTTRYWQVSVNSGTWTTLHSEARTTTFTATNIGLVCTSPTGHFAQNLLLGWEVE